ncbi:MAG: patatin-like phospholipase family protein [Candidatus Aenigmarchaeota archaeon]|nr:patatin-like phospholipase family protein [Candidatus Aenigmarchaeota archaeon]
MKIGLALSGGGTKGLAHIGVIKVLEKNNIPIDYIAGASAGSIIGGIYASGTPIEELERKISSLRTRDFLSFLIDFGKEKGGIIKAEKLMKQVRSLIKERYIENFKIGFAAIAADIANFKEVVFDKGDVLFAIRASIAYPGLVSPVRHKNMVLVDGGIVNNFPLDVLKRKGMDFIIGVRFSYSKKTKIKGYRDVIQRSLKMMEVFLNEYKNKDIKNCVILEPNIKGISTFSISAKLARKAIRAGEREAKKKMPLIKEGIERLKNEKIS